MSKAKQLQVLGDKLKLAKSKTRQRILLNIIDEILETPAELPEEDKEFMKEWEACKNESTKRKNRK